VNDTTLAPSAKSGVRAARERARLTQVQVADELNVPLDTYRRWDRGITRPRQPEQLQHLAEILGTTLDQLYPPDNDPHVHAARARRAHAIPAPTPAPVAASRSDPSPIPDPQEVLETLRPTHAARRTPPIARVVATAVLLGLLALAGVVVLAATSGSPRAGHSQGATLPAAAPQRINEGAPSGRPIATAGDGATTTQSSAAKRETKHTPRHRARHKQRRAAKPKSPSTHVTTASSQAAQAAASSTPPAVTPSTTPVASHPASTGCVVSDFTPIC
jgi:transcriptional regulator with XRE-family HTH domain